MSHHRSILLNIPIFVENGTIPTASFCENNVRERRKKYQHAFHAYLPAGTLSSPSTYAVHNKYKLNEMQKISTTEVYLKYAH